MNKQLTLEKPKKFNSLDSHLSASQLLSNYCSNKPRLIRNYDLQVGDDNLSTKSVQKYDNFVSKDIVTLSKLNKKNEKKTKELIEHNNTVNKSTNAVINFFKKFYFFFL